MRALIKSQLALIRLVRSTGQRGQTLVEYTIILAMISVMAVGVFTLLGARLTLLFSAINAILDTAQSSH